MTDLSPIQRTALKSLVGRECDGTLYRTAAGNHWIRSRLRALSPRRVRNLLRELQRSGLVEPEWITSAGAVLGWSITPAGLAAIEAKGGRARG